VGNDDNEEEEVEEDKEVLSEMPVRWKRRRWNEKRKFCTRARTSKILAKLKDFGG
jgi:hypothetical protein